MSRSRLAPLWGALVGGAGAPALISTVAESPWPWFVLALLGFVAGVAVVESFEAWLRIRGRTVAEQRISVGVGLAMLLVVGPAMGSFIGPVPPAPAGFGFGIVAALVLERILGRGGEALS